MQQLKNTVGGIWTRLRRGSQGEQPIDEIDGVNTGHSTTGLERGSSPRTRRGQELGKGNTNGTGKRGREAEDVGPEQKRVRQSVARQMPTLLPNFDRPPEAQPISLEQPRKEVSRSSNTNGTRRVGAGSYKPGMNTLNDSRHVATTNTRFMGGMNEKQITRTLPRLGGLDTERSRGHNVPPARGPYGDGFEDDAKRVPKRQKISNGASKQLPVQDKIDLTNDDSQMDTTTSVHGQKAHDYAVLAPAPTAASAFEEPSVASKVNKYTAVEHEKKKRKPMGRNSQSSGQSSAPGTPEESQIPQLSTQRTAKRPQGVVVVDDTFNDNDKNLLAKSASRPNARPTRPRITAPSGAPTRQLPKANPGSPQDIVGSTALVNARRRPSGSSPAKREHSHLEFAAPEPPARDSKQRSNRQEVRQRTNGAKDARLQDTFVRDSGAAPSSQAGASTRRAGMQATSDGPRTRVSLGSEDELAGEANVPTSASRSVSPQKNRAQIAEKSKKNRQSTSQRELSPSTLFPAAFYSQAELDAKHQSRGAKATQNESRGEMNEDRMRIRGILCRACCIVAGDIQLIWNPKANGFLVEHDGVVRKVPNKDQLVNISGQEVRMWSESTGKNVLVVQIGTSMSANSNGHVLIEFENAEDRSICFQTLLSASRDTMKCKKETPGRMIEIFNNLSSAIREDFRKRSRPDPELELMRSSKQRRTIEQPDDDEQIKYEQQSTRSSRRSNMQAGTPDSTESSRIVSKHFQPAAERRTSRQLKPVKMKSPTPPPPPPRWSHIHKLQPWSQSVIYPPEGAVRRVTVDSQDIERLDEGEFLNDNLISFALRRTEENMPSQHKEKVLYFNTFFYSALTTKNGRKVFNYDAVKRWTKNKDLLSIPYVVVPINIDLHWFVAIICNLPNLSRKFDGSDSENDEDSEMLLNGLEDGQPDLLTGLSNAIGADADLDTTNTQTSFRNLSLSDDDKVKPDNSTQADLIKDSIEPSSSRPSTATSKKSKKKRLPRQRTFDPDAPTIITLDSFGSTHPAENRNLKEYIVSEAQEKRNISLSRDDLQGVTAKGIPEQKNFCDCGLFLIGYIEEFAKDPRAFVSKLLRKQQADLGKDFANFDPSKKREQIRDQLLKLHDEQDAERKAKKIAKKSGICTGDEGSKIAQTSTATAAEAQYNNDKNAVKPDKTTSTVPAKTQAAHPTDVEVADETPNDIGVVKSKLHNADSDEIETAIPRALDESLPRLHEPEEPAPGSKTVEPPTNEDDESAWEGIVPDHEQEPSKGEAMKKLPNSIYDHDIEHYVSPEQSRLLAKPPRSTPLQQDDENQVASESELHNASRSSAHIPTQLQSIDLEEDAMPEVQDSQEQDTFKFTVRTEVS